MIARRVSLFLSVGVVLGSCAAPSNEPAADVTLPSVSQEATETAPPEGDPRVNERGNLEAPSAKTYRSPTAARS